MNCKQVAQEIVEREKRYFKDEVFEFDDYNVVISGSLLEDYDDICGLCRTCDLWDCKVVFEDTERDMTNRERQLIESLCTVIN